MNQPRIVLASANAGKLRELCALLGSGVEISSANEHGVILPEETGTTFAENAALKAIHVAQETGAIAIADDSGLCVDALDGAPGVYSARYSGEGATDAANNTKLIDALADVPDSKRGAYFASAICIAFTPDDTVISDGTCHGTIGRAPRGDGGFGYDPLFVLPDGRTMAELPSDEKNRISHRARAMEHAVATLRTRLGLAATENVP